MEFCVISPTEGLHRYATRSKRHMVLAPQFMKDPAYARFYRDQRAMNDFIILDNGVYEKEFKLEDFVETIRRLEPDVAVLPDVICGGKLSTQHSRNFLLTFVNEFPKVRWMYIPQGKDMVDWSYSSNQIGDFLQLAPIWVGLTRFLPTHTAPSDPLIRVRLAQLIHTAWPNVPIHCMGMANGSVQELTMLAKQGIVESIDSSAPVWRGWLGFDLLADRSIWNVRGKDVDFSASIDKADVQLIERNLEVTFEHCSQ